MGFPRSFPSPGDLPDPGTELVSPALQVDSLPESLVNYPKTLIKPSTKKRECMFMDEHRCFHAQECWPLLSSGMGVAGRLAHVGRCPVEGNVTGACPQHVRADNHQGPSPGLCKTVVCSLLDRPL